MKITFRDEKKNLLRALLKDYLVSLVVFSSPRAQQSKTNNFT